jgi:hypothetical protein
MKDLNDERFTIYIIESLRSSDKLTGTLLHKEILKYIEFKFPDLDSVLIPVSSKNEFLKEMDTIINEVKEHRFAPILQIEAHGFDFGIVLASGEIVTWLEFLDKTRELNTLLKNKLILILSLCEGNSVIGSIDPEKRAPFKAIIGSFKKVNSIDLLIGLEEFYTSFFSSSPIMTSVQKMNEIGQFNNPLFYLISSDECFDSIVDLNRDPIELQTLINQIAVNEKVTKQQFEGVDFCAVKQAVNMNVNVIFENVAKKRDYFNMKDLT